MNPMKRNYAMLWAAVAGLFVSCSQIEIPDGEQLGQEIIQTVSQNQEVEDTLLGKCYSAYLATMEASSLVDRAYSEIVQKAKDDVDNETYQKATDQRVIAKRIVGESHFDRLWAEAAEALANQPVPCSVQAPVTSAEVCIEPPKVENGRVKSVKIAFRIAMKVSGKIEPGKFKITIYDKAGNVLTEEPIGPDNIYSPTGMKFTKEGITTFEAPIYDIHAMDRVEIGPRQRTAAR